MIVRVLGLIQLFFAVCGCVYVQKPGFEYGAFYQPLNLAFGASGAYCLFTGRFPFLTRIVVTVARRRFEIRDQSAWLPQLDPHRHCIHRDVHLHGLGRNAGIQSLASSGFNRIHSSSVSNAKALRVEASRSCGTVLLRQPMRRGKLNRPAGMSPVIAGRRVMKIWEGSDARADRPTKRSSGPPCAGPLNSVVRRKKHLRCGMPEYLVGFSYHEPEPFSQWQHGLIEDHESSTAVWVAADTSAEAVAWGERVGEALHRRVNDDPTADWAAAGHSCWVEESPEASCWAHCLDFFLHVQVGELPLLDRMGAEAYNRWLVQRPA